MLPSQLDLVLRRLAFLGAPKVFIFAILLLTWQTFFDLKDSSEYQVVEYYAGVARIARLSKNYGYKTAAFDVVYGELDLPTETFDTSYKRSTNFKSAFDLTTSAGFGLALSLVLQGKLDECISFWGICCSSWIHMNSGTSKRNHLTPMGCTVFDSVQKANLLVSRSILLIVLCIAMNGIPVLENPGNSLIWLHDRFQWMLGVLDGLGLRLFKQKFWMCFFESPSMKRTCLWSTSSAIVAFQAFVKMRRDDFKFEQNTAERYKNRFGEVAYKGTALLKQTQIYTPKFASFVVRMIPYFNDPKRKQKFPQVPMEKPFEVFEDMAWGDLWEDACMRDVVAYLKGSKRLRVPQTWAHVVPKEL